MFEGRWDAVSDEVHEGENYGPVTYGGGLPATVLCAYFQFDRDHAHPLVAALPSLIHIRGTDSHEFAWL